MASPWRVVGIALAISLAGGGGVLLARKTKPGAKGKDVDMLVPFIPASHFQASPTRRRIDWIVIHTTEPTPASADALAPGVALSTARYFQNPDTAVSAHFVVGSDEAYQSVKVNDIAWHAKGANDVSVGIELTGRASFSPEVWASSRAAVMLDKAARIAAAVAEERGIPIAFVDAAGLLRGERGITTHAEVSKAFKQSDHTDPGAFFPMSDFLDRVEGEMLLA